MAFNFDRHTLRRLSSTVVTGAMMPLLLIAAARIYHNEAAWFDYLVLLAGGMAIYLTSILWLIRRRLQALDRAFCDDEVASQAWTFYRSPLGWDGSFYPYPRTAPSDRTRSAQCQDLPGHGVAIAPPLQRVDRRVCQDLQLLDTQWAELCQHQAQMRYLHLLKHGVPPQDAYSRALTGALCTFAGD